MSHQKQVLRIVEYAGDAAWVDGTLARSIQGCRHVAPGARITAVTIDANNVDPVVLFNLRKAVADSGMRANDHTEDYDANQPVRPTGGAK